MAGQTVVEKIATRYAVGLDPGQVARAGDFVTIRPKHIMTHDNTSAVMGKFKTRPRLGGRGSSGSPPQCCHPAAGRMPPPEHATAASAHPASRDFTTF